MYFDLFTLVLGHTLTDLTGMTSSDTTEQENELNYLFLDPLGIIIWTNSGWNNLQWINVRQLTGYKTKNKK